LRWAELGEAIAWREAAFGHAAEIRPTIAVQAQLGPPPPPGDSSRAAWRTAAAAIEAHRDLWSLPDQPLALTPTLGRDRAPELVSAARNGVPAGRSAQDDRGDSRDRRISELRVLSAIRQFEQARDRGHTLDLGR
jgi:hypothetical protein